jgi:gluconokinase
MVIVLMGVSGSGKTTIGKRLAEVLGWPYYEGDDFHPPANVEKMRGGAPLTDADRAPWLAVLGTLIQDLIRREQSAVLGCSALKQSYRNQLSGGSSDVRFVYLKGEEGLIRGRLAARRGHYFDPRLLTSQLATLEDPRDALVVDGARPPDAIVADIKRGLDLP